MNRRFIMQKNTTIDNKNAFNMQPVSMCATCNKKCDFCQRCFCNCSCQLDLKQLDKKYIMNNCECFLPDADAICCVCNGCRECSSRFSCRCR